MNCRVCGVELTDDNWYPTYKRDNRKLCKQCHLTLKKTSKYKEWEKKYRRTNKYQQYHKEYNINYLSNPKIRKHRNEVKKEWNKTLKGKLNQARKNSKRRELKHIPLNECEVDGWEGHHINKEYVVYIPKELHRSIAHNVFSGKNMKEINEKINIWFNDYYKVI